MKKVFNTPTNYKTLFPNEEYNNISEDYSVYGPGAYLVYLLDIATNKDFVEHSDEQKKDFVEHAEEQEGLELFQRRPDLNLLQINANNNRNKHHYLEGVVNVLLNKLTDWSSPDKNSWKRVSHENPIWQDIAAGTISFIPYNRTFEIIKNRLEKVELPLHEITAKLDPESYKSIEWVNSRLGLNSEDVKIITSGSTDQENWLENTDDIAINKLFYANENLEKKLSNLINNKAFLSYFGMGEISLVYQKNEVSLKIGKEDLKKLRSFMILANATKWNYSTLTAVLQVLEIKEFSKENIEKIARLSLIAEVFEDIKKSEFLNKSLVKNRLSSINLSFTNKNIKSQSTDEENILHFLNEFASNNLLNSYSGKIQTVFSSMNFILKNTTYLGKNLQLNNETIDTLFKIATFIKRFQETGHTIDELSNYISALSDNSDQKRLSNSRLADQILSDIYVMVEESKDLSKSENPAAFEIKLSTYLSDHLFALWGIDRAIVNKYISSLQIANKLVCNNDKIKGYETVEKITDEQRKGIEQLRDEFVKIIETRDPVILFTQIFSISKDVTAIYMSDLLVKKIVDNEDMIAFFEHSIGVLHLQKYLDESTEDHSDFIECLSNEKINIENLILQLAQREKCTQQEITEIFGQYKISGSSDRGLLYQTLYKVRVYRKIYNKLQLSASDVTEVIKEKQEGISVKLDSLLTEELYGEQLMADRDILVPMVFHKLSKKYEDITNSDRLSEYLLMDVQVSDKIKITPLREAINAVQWYMANMKSGLEDVDYTKLSEISAKDWLHIEKFRIWQAEQKLKLYPNEYFQVDNRIETTEIFNKVKSDLQNEHISDEKIRNAFSTYINDWGKLSQNKIVDGHTFSRKRDGKNIICILSKSSTENSTFLYNEIAYKHSSYEEYCHSTGWSRIDLQINAETASIIYAFNKYYLFWSEVSSKKVTTTISNKQYNYTLYTLTIKYSSQNIDKQWSAPKIFDSFDFYLEYENEVPFLKDDNFKRIIDELLSPNNITMKPHVMFFDNKIVLYHPHFNFNNKINIEEPDENLRSIRKISDSLYNLIIRIKNCLSDEKFKNQPLIRPKYLNINEIVNNFNGTIDFFVQNLMLFEAGDSINENKILYYQNDVYKEDFIPDNNTQLYINSVLNRTDIKDIEVTKNRKGKIYLERSIGNFGNNFLEVRTLNNNKFLYTSSVIKMSGSSSYLINTDINTIIILEHYNPSHLNARRLNNYNYVIEKDSEEENYTVQVREHEYYGNIYLTFNELHNNYAIYLENLFKSKTFESFWKINLFCRYPNPLKLNYHQNYNVSIAKLMGLKNNIFSYNDYSPGSIQFSESNFIGNGIDRVYANEFFLYLPIMLINYLKQNLQFEQALKLFNTVFDINDVNAESTWKNFPFYIYPGNDEDSQVMPYRKFIISKKKWLFEQYVTTLFDWADHEYRTFSVESINHATQLYLQIEDLLGEEIKICNANQKLDQIGDRSFLSIKEDKKNKKNDYFGTPSHNTINELIKKVQGRLYNLRNGLNIDGSMSTPSEYGAVIDPVSVQLLRNTNSLDSHGLQSLQDKKRIYQFRDLMPITESIIDTTIQFGNQFYSILQQKDSEEIQLLMHTQTMAAELFVTQNFELQIQEIELQLNAMRTNQQSAQLQLAYYNNLLTSGIIEQERESFSMQKDAHGLQLIANTGRTFAAAAHLMPNIFGVANGGMKFGDAIEATANVADMIAHNKILKAQLITDEAEAKRRALDLAKEINLSKIHLEEIDINIKATEKRLEIIKSSLAEHNMRIDQQKTMLDHLTTKFTNVDLYSWMSSKLSSLYFSVYQIGLNSLNQLQESYNYELNHKVSFIPQNNWDSLKKGLLAGEGLKLALTQLKESYFRNNVRRKEVEKVISLRKKIEKEINRTKNEPEDAEVNAKQKAKIKAEAEQKWENFIDTGNITFSLVDKDFYSSKSSKLRIKSLSVSVPGVVGPYETFDITLKNTSLNQEIEISRGINDFGVFPESMNDGRYMPFEGLEITDENQQDWTLQINERDGIEISDIILTVRLTIL